MNNLFYNCNSIKNINFININTDKVNNMSEMFYHCKSLTSINLKNFNTENVIDMNKIFYNCSSLKSIDISNFNISKTINISKIFYGCNSLKFTNISSFIFEKNISLFSDIPEYCTIWLNIKSLNKISNIPKTCSIFSEDKKCLRVHNSSINGKCIDCKGEFELYNGDCILYAFYATYYINYYDEEVYIFNSQKEKDLYAMKINNIFMKPKSPFKLNNIQNQKVYYYLSENVPISLSNLFENVTKLVDFSFNGKYMDNYFITNISGILQDVNWKVYQSIYQIFNI